MLLEDFGVPVPGEILLITAALLAFQGEMHIVPVLLIACVGAVTGGNIGYGIGRFGGRKLMLGYGRYLLITEGGCKKLRHSSASMEEEWW